MTPDIERNLGEQPIARILLTTGLKAQDLVAGSAGTLTFKMISRACKGRRLNPPIQERICRAVNAATNGTYAVSDLFNYG